MIYTLYILKCNDDSLYTGITNDLIKRLRQHNGEIIGGAKYTSGRRPVTLLYREEYESRSDALKREHEIKSYSRKKKLMLIEW